ncbi:hypothetical protein [Pseudarthrobacter sp. 1C304]|uniref:hypothetical protein n=1 Tax=Pseudarthrobacter sp. 1C304 TaxID=3457438 RepID=UPI003FD33284
MEDPTTIALNLTFFGTLAVALVMFFGLFLVFVATLVLAGLGRLAAVIIMAVGRVLLKATGRSARPAVTAPEVTKPGKAAKPVKPAKPAKKEPELSPDWAAAVAQADARAAARAKAEAAPAVRVSVRELPSPTVPARDVTAVAPLVESATDRNGQLGTVPPAFKKAAMPAAQSLLDTGSLVSVPGRLPLPQKPPHTQQAQQRPAARAQERKAG